MPRRSTRGRRQTSQHEQPLSSAAAHQPVRRRKTGGRLPSTHHAHHSTGWGSPYHGQMTSCYRGNAATLGGGGSDTMNLIQAYSANMSTLRSVRDKLKGATEAAEQRTKGAVHAVSNATETAWDKFSHLFK